MRERRRLFTGKGFETFSGAGSVYADILHSIYVRSAGCKETTAHLLRECSRFSARSTNFTTVPLRKIDFLQHDLSRRQPELLLKKKH